MSLDGTSSVLELLLLLLLPDSTIKQVHIVLSCEHLYGIWFCSLVIGMLFALTRSSSRPPEAVVPLGSFSKVTHSYGDSHGIDTEHRSSPSPHGGRTAGQFRAVATGSTGTKSTSGSVRARHPTHMRLPVRGEMPQYVWSLQSASESQ